MSFQSEATGQEIAVTVTGMTCSSCAGRVERALAAIPQVSAPKVNLLTNKAHMLLADPAALPDVIAALKEAGYPAETSETRLLVEGMTCASCSGRVERALSAIPGVTDARVNLANGTATVSHIGLPGHKLAEAVTSRTGYAATVAAKTGSNEAQLASHMHHENSRNEAETLRRDVILAAALTLPVFILEMGGHAVPAFHHWLYGIIDIRYLWIFQFVLTAAVLAGPGRRFFKIGIPALLRGAPEMNSLVALGAGAAFLYSTVATFMPSILPPDSVYVYFEAAAVIVTLILAGRWLEARAKGRAGEAIRRLIELTPDTAKRMTPTGETEDIAIAEIRPGDILRLLPGERVAADGIISEGRGSIDESMLTGEPLPVTKTIGDPVTGGTVNGNTAMLYRVNAVGADTALARIVAMVESAQAARLPVQDMVDRVTRIFVPAVMALAVLTLAVWLVFGPEPKLSHALVAAISVLIIACPCAMGLAVPVSILVGTGRGAELGVLFRRGEALQRLAEARIVAFDKTGTLTIGSPALTHFETADGVDADTALRLAAGAEAQSEHPLAAAIIKAANEAGLDIPAATDVEALTGRGLVAKVEGHDVLAGNRAALEDASIAVDSRLAQTADRLAAEGGTPVHLAVDGRHMAVLILSDPIRDDAVKAISGLHEIGLETAMISGDTQATADAIGAKLGIDRIMGNTSPQGKLEAIGHMGSGTVFVGDGINDAPALAAAETGIAIGTGTDVAIETADAVLMGGKPSSVTAAIRLSRAVMRNIKQNLFWAFGYNILLIPVAMGVLVPFGGPQLSPMLGAGAMALSSVFVVGNALRLRRFK